MAKKKQKRPINQIKPDRVRQELDPDDAIAVRYIHQFSSLLTGKTLEQTELDFLRDADPSAEIALWISLIGVARRFCELNPAADFKAVLKSMLHISKGMDPPLQEVKEFADAHACHMSIDYFDRWLDAQA